LLWDWATLCRHLSRGGDVNFLIRIVLLSVTFSCFQSKAQTVTVVQSAWPPFIYDTTPPSGVIVDIVRSAFRNQGYEMKLNVKPWSRAMKEVMTSRTDLLLAVWYTEKRAERLLFSDSYLDSKQVIISLKGHEFEYLGLSSLKGKTIGTIRDYAYDEAFLASKDFARLESDSLTQSIRRMEALRVDAIISNERFAKYTFSGMAILQDEYVILSPSVSISPLYIAAGLSNPRAQEMIQAFNLGLVAIKDNGEYEAIIRRYSE
ncbi:transporter substrate-binding domain-containing protein, partial [Vibrio makurazakiensis]|uniref:substrate-binding periplasmic protein n=1 Tax=Vibrio makurazakiensis TaxID=2910250 RepID=UPI003D142EA6